jgi:putative FmdB family regulatory protein
MPTYEYECQKCGHVFDEFQSISAPPVANCPVEGCGGEAKRRFSPGAGFIFKGSGFYITDYRSDSYKKGAKADAPASPPSSNGSSSTTNTGTPPSSSSASSPSSSAPSSSSSKPSS